MTTVLENAGNTIENLLHIKVYVKGEIADLMEKVQPIFANFVGSNRPSVTAVGVASLASKDLLVEIEAIAYGYL